MRQNLWGIRAETSALALKGTYSPMIFSTSSSIHHLNQPGPMTNGLKYLRFLFGFHLDIRISVPKKLTPLCIITRGVKKNLILEQWCKIQKCSPLKVE